MIIAYTIAMTALIIALFVVVRQRDRAREEAGRAMEQADRLAKEIVDLGALWVRGWARRN